SSLSSPRPPIPTLCPYTTLFRSRSLHPEVQRLISTGQVDRIFVDEQVDVDLMLVRAPETMDFARRTPSELRCRQTVLIGHGALRSEEHTSELQSRFDLVCRLLLE